MTRQSENGSYHRSRTFRRTRTRRRTRSTWSHHFRNESRKRRVLLPSRNRKTTDSSVHGSRH
ncbi:hypothetical protein ACB092_03G009200 [Castanea dentata]